MGKIGGNELAVAFHMRERFAVDVDDAFVNCLKRHQHAQHGGLAGA